MNEELTQEKLLETPSENKNRHKIDKLLGKSDIRYRGIFSGRAVKILGFVFMFFSQVYICVGAMDKIAGVPATTMGIADVLNFLSIFALPMFLAANFCIIMTSRTKIKRMLIIYSVIALGIYLLVVVAFYRYLLGLVSIIAQDPDISLDIADLVAKTLFAKVINYNVFVDLALFSLFYFFLFYTPKNIKTKRSMLIFRLMSAIPIALAILATILYGLYNTGIVDLPVAVLALLPCRSIAVYAIFFGIAFVVKLRQYLFCRWGGSDEEYDRYASSNRSSLEISTLSCAIILLVSIIDFALLWIRPSLILYGIGLNFYLAFSIPFIMLLSYTRKTRPTIWDTIMVAIFIFAVIVLYLETGLYIFKNL